VWIAAAAVLSAQTSITGTLKGVENRYNNVRSLQVEFTQETKAQAGMRKPESGTLFLRKPGRMRWEYASPEGKLFVSDGKWAYLVTPGWDVIQKMDAKRGEDMRAPLAFLLGRLDFQRDFNRFEWRQAGEDTYIAAYPKSPNLPYTKVEFQVTPKYEIRRVVVTGQDFSVMDFKFTQEKVNPALDAKLFQYSPPAGARVEEIAN
jgi:outer membrane lipoprotein carrier protein